MTKSNIHAHRKLGVYKLSNSILEWDINEDKSTWNLYFGNVVTERLEKLTAVRQAKPDRNVPS